MILENYPAVQSLSPPDKLLLVSELWNDLAEHPAEFPISPTVIAELDERMEDFRTHPEQFTTWEKMTARLKSGSR